MASATQIVVRDVAQVLADVHRHITLGEVTKELAHMNPKRYANLQPNLLRCVLLKENIPVATIWDFTDKGTTRLVFGISRSDFRSLRIGK